VGRRGEIKKERKGKKKGKKTLNLTREVTPTSFCKYILEMGITVVDIITPLDALLHEFIIIYFVFFFFFLGVDISSGRVTLLAAHHLYSPTTITVPVRKALLC